MRACEQKICDLRGTGKCPICSECKAPPDKVSDDNCVDCWCCEHDCGYVRGSNKNVDVEQKVGIMIIQPTTGE